MIFPNFDPVLIQIGPLAIRWYALAYVTGILLGWRYAVRLTKNPKLWGGQTPTCTSLQIDDLVLWVTLGIILGGRMGYVLFYDTALIWRDPLEIFKVWHGGMSFHGGLIGVILAVVGFARGGLLRDAIRAALIKRGLIKEKPHEPSAPIDVMKLGDLVAPVVPIGLGFGRIANFINGELWGRPTDVPWGVVFPAAGPYPRHPSQIYEALLEGLLLFVVLRLATHRFGWLQRRGGVAGLFLAGYALIRISLENVREPDSFMPDFPLGLTMGMLLSLPMLAVGAWLIWRAYRETPVVTPPAAIEA